MLWMLPNIIVLNLSLDKYVSLQQIDENKPRKTKVGELGCLGSHFSHLSVVTAIEMQIRSDQRYHQRVAPASSSSVKHASRHICKQLTGPFPASLFLRGLEVWHAEADLIVPRLSLNLHVRCQLPCHRHSIAPPHLPLPTWHRTRHTHCLNLWPRTWGREEKHASKLEKKEQRTRSKPGEPLFVLVQESPLLHTQVFKFNFLTANSCTVRICQKVTDEDKFEILKTTNFSPKIVMIFYL